MLKPDSTLGLENFLHWWGAELFNILPDGLKQWFRRHSERLLICPREERVHVVLQSALGEEILGDFPLTEMGRREMQEALSRKISNQDIETVLRLRRGLALRKTITLPAATAENLRQVVGFEMNRYTPFNADQVYYEVRVIEKIGGGDLIRVELVFVPRQTLEDLYEDLVAWGIRPSLVDYEESPSLPGKRQGFNLLPESLRPKVPKGPKIANTALAVVLLALIATAALLPLWLDYQLANELQERVVKEGRLAKEVEEIKAEADLLIRQTEELLEKKLREPALVEILDELTAILPNNTWLTNLQYQGRRLQIQGQSPAASALIEIIEASPLFERTSFVSPVTQDRQSGLERFQISVEVKSRRRHDGSTQ